MDDLTDEFIENSLDSLREAEGIVAYLHRNHDEKKPLSELISIIHTISGTCRFLELPRLATLSQETEAALEYMEADAGGQKTHALNILATAFSQLRILISYLDIHESEAPGNDHALCEELQAICGQSIVEASEEEVEASGFNIFATPEPSLMQEMPIHQESHSFFPSIKEIEQQVMEQTESEAVELSTADEEPEEVSVVPRLIAEAMKKPNRQEMKSLVSLQQEMQQLRQLRTKLVALAAKHPNNSFVQYINELNALTDGMTPHVYRVTSFALQEVWEAVTSQAEASLKQHHKVLRSYSEAREARIDIRYRQSLQHWMQWVVDVFCHLPRHDKTLVLMVREESEFSYVSIADEGHTRIEQEQLAPLQQQAIREGVQIELTHGLTSGAIVTFTLPRRFRRKTFFTLHGVDAEQQVAIPLECVLEVTRDFLAHPEYNEEVLYLSTLLGSQLTNLEKVRLECEFEGEAFSLMVSDISESYIAEMQPISAMLEKVSLYGGSVQGPDGEIIMVLDPAALKKAVKFNQVSASAVIPPVETPTAKPRERLLLFRAGKGALKAVPLMQVEKLAEVSVNEISLEGEQPVIVYDGRTIPLLSLDNNMDMSTDGMLQLMIFQHEQQSFALASEEIIDIREGDIPKEKTASDTHVIAKMQLLGEMVDVLDIGSLHSIISLSEPAYA